MLDIVRGSPYENWMELYRHYKNKAYKYLGIAKHSETLEDMVVYECLYPNELGKLWVRPREMFEGLIEGQPRFKKITPRVELITQIADEDLDRLRSLNAMIFSDWSESYFREGFHSKQDFLLVVAYVDATLAGYKLGYRLQKDPSVFYSWMGGVHPEYRGLGLAEDLMRAQHEWALLQGYKKVSTKTMNRFKPMLALNIKFGFDVIGTEMDERGLKILLEKTL